MSNVKFKVVKRTLNPKFSENFKFYIYDTNKMTLSIVVQDVNAAQDFNMGK